MNTNKLVAGSKLYCKKGAVRHVGVALMNGKILHISPKSGVELTDFDEFSQGQSITHTLPPADLDMWALEARASALLLKGPAYRWWAFNCEHLATYVQTGKKTSSQLQAGLVSLAGYVALSEKPNLTGALVCVGLGLLTEHAMHSAKRIPIKKSALTY